MNKYSKLGLGLLVCSMLSACGTGAQSRIAGSPNSQRAALGTTQSDVPGVSPNTAAVARSCALIPENERTQCPVRRTPVIAAREIRKPVDPKGNLTTTAGAVVYMVAAPGLTHEWLGHLIECYQAEVSASAVASADSSACPVSDPETEYAVSSTRDGFAVAMRSSSSASAQHIYELSERLASTRMSQ